MVEVYTDASWNSETKEGGYAFFIDSDDFQHSGCGYIKHSKNSNSAELYAIYMATCALVLEGIQGTIMFHTDSLHSAIMLTNRDRAQEKYPFVEKILTLLNYSIGIQWHVNYVPRNSTPEMCWADTTAKNQWMK